MNATQLRKRLARKAKFTLETEQERRHALNIAKRMELRITTRKDEKGGFVIIYL